MPDSRWYYHSHRAQNCVVTFWFFNVYIPVICRGEKQKGRKKKGPFFYKVWLCACSVVSICDPMDCSPPGSSVHGILQARILEWVVISSSRASFPRDQTWVSYIVGRFLPIWTSREAPWASLFTSLSLSALIWTVEIIIYPSSLSCYTWAVRQF